MHRDKVICPMSYIQLKSWNLTVAYSHNTRQLSLMQFITEGKKWIFWMYPVNFRFFLSASSPSFFSIMSNLTQAYKELEKLRILPRIPSRNTEMFQIHILLYFHMAGLGCNLDHRNLNWKNTSRFGSTDTSSSLSANSVGTNSLNPS